MLKHKSRNLILEVGNFPGGDSVDKVSTVFPSLFLSQFPFLQQVTYQIKHGWDFRGLYFALAMMQEVDAADCGLLQPRWVGLVLFPRRFSRGSQYFYAGPLPHLVAVL